jgi:hypothetical protein
MCKMLSAHPRIPHVLLFAVARAPHHSLCRPDVQRMAAQALSPSSGLQRQVQSQFVCT